MSFDLRRALRRIKPEAYTKPLTRRLASSLRFVGESGTVANGVLIDTSVYIDVLQSTAPPPVEAILRARSTNHCALCVAELLHAFGRLSPIDPRTATFLRRVILLAEDIPAHRLASASSGVIAEAGILAGLLFRLGGGQKGQEVAALNDATIYLQALAKGHTVVTRNVRDFDLLNQIVPEGRVLFYERVP